MGSAFSCFESGSWDHAHHALHAYRPQPEGQQSYSQPLSHYFISSGHNSYLQGNQLTSTAGTATIELGLKHGCRVVELDVYDGDHDEPVRPAARHVQCACASIAAHQAAAAAATECVCAANPPWQPKNNQVVTHGGTLTSSVTFRDCVKAVARHAFSASPYPVILTIENHTKQQQVRVPGSVKGCVELAVPKAECRVRAVSHPADATSQSLTQKVLHNSSYEFLCAHQNRPRWRKSCTMCWAATCLCQSWASWSATARGCHQRRSSTRWSFA
jgi:hypothetical protein